jgi:23S rRNA (cytidine1920-2'-O)/16S rRNA (cytidine1409-2'-O)-methyltransferase
MSRQRLDKKLLELGFASSREKAQALIMSGLVVVDGIVADKPGFLVKEGQRIEVKEGMKYVSRGGYKLEHALERFKIDVKGLVALDVGSSTGGFTDCLLQKGTLKVYAVDVGRAQMDIKLRNDPRVILYEETDARSLTEKHIPQKVDLITVDVSFISVNKILSHILKFLKDEGIALILVKPQFELTPEKVRKGIVRNPEDKTHAVLKVCTHLNELGFNVGGVVKSKPKGLKGNEEFFVLAGRHLTQVKELQKLIEDAVRETL